MSPMPSSVPTRLRPSLDTDLDAIAAIYAWNVQNGTGSFEEVAPSRDELGARRRDIIAKGLPYMVAERDTRVVGYAYVNLYRPRQAYRFTLEDSIYLSPDAQGGGIGSALLADLITQSTALGYRQMIAVIGDSQNQGSIRLHAKAGFMHTGTLRSIGFKFGRWIDSVMMQRDLGPGDGSLPTERLR